jgi:hypothetical protein
MEVFRGLMPHTSRTRKASITIPVAAGYGKEGPAAFRKVLRRNHKGDST